MHEVDRSVLPATRGDRHRPAVQTDALSPSHSHTNLEAVQLVQPVNPVAKFGGDEAADK
jgi:hypothetical protein